MIANAVNRAVRRFISQGDPASGTGYLSGTAPIAIIPISPPPPPYLPATATGSLKGFGWAAVPRACLGGGDFSYLSTRCAPHLRARLALRRHCDSLNPRDG